MHHYFPTGRNYHKINGVWCVAPMDSEPCISQDIYKIFHGYIGSYGGDKYTLDEILKGFCFETDGDRIAYENALKLGIEK